MNTTAWWILAILAVGIGYDIFAEWRWGYPGTISFDVKKAYREYRIIGIIMGGLIGHLLISRTSGSAELLKDIWPVFIGIALGTLLWSQ